MGFILGSPGLLRSPIQSQSFSSSTSLFSPSPPLWSHSKVAKKKVVAMASPHCESPGEETSFLRRRAVLLVGISVLPLLELRAVALEGRGARRGVRILDEMRRRAQEKQNIELPEVPKQPEQEMLSQEPVQVPKLQEQEILSKEPNQSELVDLKTASGDSSTSLDKQDARITEEQAPKQQQEEISFRESDPAEQAHQQTSSGNSSLSLLNGLGIVGSGMLGALYATSQREKSGMESSIESMKTKLNEKEAAIALLKEGYETRLLNEQEEHRKQVRRLKEEEASLSGQLASANGTLGTLRQELQNEKRQVEDLKAQIGQLESGITQAGEDKKMLEAKLKGKMDTVDVLQNRVSLLTLEINDKEKSAENLRLSVAEKESECKNFSSIIDQTKAELAEANTTAENLKVENFKIREDLASRNSLINELNEKIKSLDAEQDWTSRRIHDLMKEYDDLKSSSEKTKALDSELLSKKDDELHQLEEKLRLALGEVGSNQTMIGELTKERDDIRAMLEKEVNNMKIVEDELRIAQEALGASRNETSCLSKELEEAKISCEELTFKLSKIQDEFSETKRSLTGNLDEAKSALKVLSEELVSVKGVLKSTSDELSVASNELKAAMEERESLKNELMDIYKKAETSAHELKEEKNLVATLNRELEVLGKQLHKDAAARRALEADLDEATKSLDEMNKSALLLSRELENTNSRSSSLEAEKAVLYKSLAEQKNMTNEAKENLEDAQNLIMRLGSERESLEKRSKKLGEELASAKGEILRLRREISMIKESVNERHQTTNEISAGTPFAARKTVNKRRKGGAASDC